jgi:mevalonate kinase
MKWQIPAKTFLVGEYAAIVEESAIILTTKPLFELSVNTDNHHQDIHPHSPAGKWWQQQHLNLQSLDWYDPYNGVGGMGASSAQFLACYLAASAQNKRQPQLKNLLADYYQASWSGEGLRPSGYDIIAQSQGACVFINKKRKSIESFPWIFSDLSLLIVHTGIKLATHEHLKMTSMLSSVQHLSSIVEQARLAFERVDNQLLIQSVNNYHNELKDLHLVHPNSLSLIEELKKNPRVLGIKGCGAFGTDTLLILAKSENKADLLELTKSMGLAILATESQITSINQTGLINIQL